MMRVDLHLHTTASDGAWSPDRVVAAARGRLDVLAIADHDTVAGVEPAIEAAEGLPVEVLPAIEVSTTTHDGREIHVLGYAVDLDAPALRDHAARAVRLREERIVGMIDRLRGLGVQVAMEAVLEAAGPDRSALGRPHLARALVAAGHASDVPDAFNRWIGDDLPAFLPTRLGTPEEGVEVIAAAGGLPVWAHPPADLVDPLLPGLIRAGLEGLEVYRPRMPQDQVRRLEGVARSAGLLMTGGSDWHTPDAGSRVGDFHVTADEVGGFLEAVGF